MSGRRWLDAGARAELGRVVRAARSGGVAWKVLENLYGRSRWTLSLYADCDSGRAGAAAVAGWGRWPGATDGLAEAAPPSGLAAGPGNGMRESAGGESVESTITVVA